MAKINIEGFEELMDNNHRYQMNKIEITNEKHMTILQNLDKVSIDLGREEKMIIYFFKKYFGTNFVKTKKSLKYATKKKLSAKELQDALKEFIEYCVLCPTCRLPETNLKVSGDKVLVNCICCGHTDKINMNNVNSKSMKDVFGHMTQRVKTNK